MHEQGDYGVDTGRLKTALAAEAQRIVYGRYESPHDDELGSELSAISEIDRAHLVMLLEEGIVDPRKVRLILRQIDALRSLKFQAVRNRPMPRGAYLAYESYLMEELGEQVGGVIHTGRSRNDLNAATVRLRAREPYGALVMASARLCDVLLVRAAQHRGIVMPAYTHGQAAVPITYGHYLAAIACSMIRDIEALLRAGEELETNPLGAGAVGGTSLPINSSRTTGLLGFTRAVANSVDAVASRDFVLRILSASAILGVGLTRAARDIATWATEEFGFLHVPDDLVGSSSMMPQKRNLFLLEHVQGKAAGCLGSFVSAASAMSTAGYTNAIAVSAESIAYLWPGLRNGTEATDLLRLVVDGAVPVESRMLDRARSGNTVATYLAEVLVRRGIAFRIAHYQVGKMVREAAERGAHLSTAAAASLGDDLDGLRPDHASLEPASVVRAAKYGGGPGETRALLRIDRLRSQLTRQCRVLAERQERWENGRRALDEAVQRISSEGN
jgi:argininosuccinate lyase